MELCMVIERGESVSGLPGCFGRRTVRHIEEAHGGVGINIVLKFIVFQLSFTLVLI